jgi:SAM-dependent methyltransferase
MAIASTMRPIMPPDSKERFSDRVDDYERARPGYPAEIIPLLQREIGLTPDWTIADIGSGTGISTRPFLNFGNTVYAVEPNRAMREAAERTLVREGKFRSIDGSAEATTLADQSVDLVLAGQAFHWFDAARARQEFARILRPPRWVVLMWNKRQKNSSAFLDDYERMLIRFGTDYLKIRHENVDHALLARFFGSRDYRTARFANPQPLDWQGLRSRCLSSSYVPAAEDPNRQPMLDELRGIFGRHQQGGRVVMEYVTELFWHSLAK